VRVDVERPVTLTRPRWRARLDPHVLFGFQPFNESATWEADIVRVTADGRRVPIDEPWPGGYEWDELMGWGALEDPERRKHAFSSYGAMVDFLDEALDWVADNTPRDTETSYLEARVRGTQNTRPTEERVLRSERREEVG
jgi:hypothetical protein